MTVVEDYSSEALACINDILRGRVERIGQCHITTRAISKILIERFGLSSGSVRFLTEFVVEVLVKENKLRLWDMKAKTDVYTVIVENLLLGPDFVRGA